MADKSATRSAKLTVRMRPEEREILEQAAQETGRYAAQFLRWAGLQEARRVVRENGGSEE